MDIVNENITLSELSHKENLSVRSLNICKWNGLNDIITILNYYWKNNDFFNLRNCGQKSNTELIELCQKHEVLALRPNKKEFENPIKKQIDSLTIRQKKILNNLIESQTNNLSVRSLNAIENISDSELTIRGFKEVLIDPNYDLRKIKNIGEKSVKELNKFFKEIREQIDIIQLFKDDDELTVELFNTYLRRRFSLTSNHIDEIWNNYDFKNGLPVFKTIEILIKHGYIFNNNEQEIFKKGFNFWSNKSPETLENIASSINLTTERARQIRKKLLTEIDSKLIFLKGLEFDALNLYGIDIELDLIVIDDNLIDEIQQKESVNYNNVFVTKTLSLLISKTHTLIGKIESCVFNSTKPKGLAYKWKSIYLVSKEIDNMFNFESLAIDINKRLSERIEEDYSFHFETYLISFFNEGFDSYSYLVTQISEHIIFNEFEITIDTFDQITFKKNTKKQVGEYVRDILNEKKHPLDVYQIYDILISKHPDVTKSAEALRGSCHRDSKLIYFGRSSTYGLREWEKDEAVKGGTMHDIAEEYLMQFETPKHIEDIRKYVSQYRPSVTSKSLLNNLKSAENRRFLSFKNYHIGLVAKKYKDEFTRTNETKIIRRTWNENFKLLVEFTRENNKLPFYLGNEEEQRLYHFIRNQLNKVTKNTNGQIKSNIVEAFVKNHGYKKRDRRNH